MTVSRLVLTAFDMAPKADWTREIYHAAVNSLSVDVHKIAYRRLAWNVTAPFVLEYYLISHMKIRPDSNQDVQDKYNVHILHKYI